MTIRNTLACFAASAAVIVALALAAAFLFVFFGVYNVAATSPHWQPVYWLIETTAVRSISWRARHIAVPDLSQPAQAMRGLTLFNEHCVLCHGAPGVAPHDFAKGLAPGAPPLAQTGRDWQPQELYWAIRHGIKMTAMPAWEFRLNDSDLWALVAFLRVLPRLSPAEYRALLPSRPEASKPKAESSAVAELPRAPADAGGGKTAFHQYACHMCHQAPGISGPQAQVGTPLHGLAKRRYIAGVLENTPENMMLWIRHPQAVKPFSAMPDLGVTAAHARDIVAFLYTLE
jgi:mono/diheme cytochrome c family protein/cytochrome c2